MRGIFVTATDTGAGKTVITGLLARFLKERGLKVITQKWIETGSKRCSCDINSHLQLMNIPSRRVKQYFSLMSPYIFSFAASPHLAAYRERKNIQEERIKRSFNSLLKDFDLVIAEGIGGALVPLNQKRLVIDIAKDLRLGVLIVAANKLGAINHTLLTIEALRRRKIKIIGIVFNNLSPKTSSIILEDNPRIIKALSRENVLGILPYCRDANLLYRKFIPIGRQILSAIRNKTSVFERPAIFSEKIALRKLPSREALGGNF